MHAIIVPPLLTTMAATMAVGVGVAVARAGRERRRRERDLRLGLQAREPLGEGLRRTALGQLDLAIGLLSSPGEVEAKAVHETRKALKRLRALLRLLANELPSGTSQRESDAVRRVARSLAGARDAEVMLDTLDALVARHPGKLAGRGGVIRLRGQLLEDRERLRARDLDPATLARALIELRACRTRVAVWSFAERPGLALAEPGLLRIYRQGRRRMKRVRRGKGEEMRAMHEWRKRVKDLRYAAEMLEREAARPAPAALPALAQPARKARRSKQSRQPVPPRGVRRLQRTARRADELGEMLGEDHDLAVLRARVEHSRRRGERVMGRGARRRLLKLIDRRRRELRKRAMAAGEKLYRRPGGGFVKRVRSDYKRAQRLG